MIQLFALLSLVALFVAIASFLLALSTSIRLNAMQGAPIHRDPGLKVGSDVPTESLKGLLDATETARFLEGPTIAIFTNADCPACKELLVALATFEPPKESVFLFGEAAQDGNSSLPGWVRVVPDSMREIQRSFRVTATPQTFLIQNAKIERSMVGSRADWYRSQTAVSAHAPATT